MNDEKTENLLIEEFIELTCGELEYSLAKNILLSTDWQLDLAYEIYSDIAVGTDGDADIILSTERSGELVITADTVLTPQNKYLSNLQLQFETCFQSSLSHVIQIGLNASKFILESIPSSTKQSTTLEGPSTEFSSLGQCCCCEHKFNSSGYHGLTHRRIVKFLKEISLHQRQERSFAYVSVGSGLLALDLHNISAVLTELPVHINRLQIVIVDPVYHKLCVLVRQYLEEVQTTDNNARSIVEKLVRVVRNTQQDFALGKAKGNGVMDSCKLHGQPDQALIACLEFIASVWTQFITVKDCMDQLSSTNLNTIEIVLATDLFDLDSSLYKADTFLTENMDWSSIDTELSVTYYVIESVLWSTCYMKDIKSIRVGNIHNVEVFFEKFGEILFEGHSYPLSGFGEDGSHNTTILGLRIRWLETVLKGMNENVFYECIVQIDSIADEMKAKKLSQFCLSTFPASPNLLIFLRLIYECSKLFEQKYLRGGLLIVGKESGAPMEESIMPGNTSAVPHGLANRGRNPLREIVDRVKLEHPLMFEEKMEAKKQQEKADSWVAWRERNNICLRKKKDAL